MNLKLILSSVGIVSALLFFVFCLQTKEYKAEVIYKYPLNSKDYYSNYMVIRLEENKEYVTIKRSGFVVESYSLGDKDSFTLPKWVAYNINHFLIIGFICVFCVSVAYLLFHYFKKILL